MTHRVIIRQSVQCFWVNGNAGYHPFHSLSSCGWGRRYIYIYMYHQEYIIHIYLTSPLPAKHALWLKMARSLHMRNDGYHLFNTHCHSLRRESLRSNVNRQRIILRAIYLSSCFSPRQKPMRIHSGPFYYSCKKVPIITAIWKLGGSEHVVWNIMKLKPRVISWDFWDSHLKAPGAKKRGG